MVKKKRKRERRREGKKEKKERIFVTEKEILGSKILGFQK